MSGDLLRERYRPSGRFKVLALLAWGLAALAAAAGLGVLLYLAHVAGFYLVLLAPVLAAFVAAGVAYLAVRQAHCRNRVVAGALGLSAGVVL